MFRYDMLEKGIKSLDQNTRENLREGKASFSHTSLPGRKARFPSYSIVLTIKNIQNVG